MLVFDIETTGLNPLKNSITVVAVCDTETNSETIYNFARDGCSRAEEFLCSLDVANVIACFNGVKFDLPFVIAFFGVAESRYRHWFCKVFDYYEYCRLLFDCPCSLNRLLCSNGYQVKTSCGGQAVTMAQNKQWRELEDYCMADTTKTRDLCVAVSVVLPLQKRNMTIKCTHLWSPSGMHSLDLVPHTPTQILS